MSREIKFRAWDKKWKRMYLWEELYTRYNMSYWINDNNNNDETLALMQYAGLKDKNGKELYEGDIYHMGDLNITYTVVWHDSGFMGKQNSSKCYAGLNYWRDRVEVIGNIYENPELLEG